MEKSEILRVLKTLAQGTDPANGKGGEYLTGFYQGQRPIVDRLKALIRDMEAE